MIAEWKSATAPNAQNLGSTEKNTDFPPILYNSLFLF